VEQLGLAELHARALDVVGVSRVLTGDAGGVGDLERAIEIALEGNAFDVAAFNNLRVAQSFLGLTAEAAATIERQRESEVRFARADFRGYWMIATVEAHFGRGLWDEALAIADEFLTELEEGASHYLEAACRGHLAAIRLARGDIVEASAQSEQALELARQAKDAQTLAPVLAQRTGVILAEGRRAEAEALAAELLAFGPALVAPLVMSGVLIDFAWLVRELAREDELLVVLETAPQVPWVGAAQAILSGQPLRAASLLDEIAFRPGAAYARLRAAESLAREGASAAAEAELERALAFYRSVGATRYIEQGEQAMAALARGSVRTSAKR
jgi:tetratricopeptide (TPR) repeat protein